MDKTRRQAMGAQTRSITISVIGIAFLGVVLTAVAALAILSVQRQRSEAELLAAQARVEHGVERALDRILDRGRAVAAHMSAAPHALDDARFRDFLDRLGPNPAGLRAIAYAPRVAAGDLADFQQRTRQAASPFSPMASYRVWPEGARDVYFPALWVAPEAGNDRVFGHDILAEPTRREAVLHGLAEGWPAIASGPIVLSQDQATGRPGLLVIHFVFETVKVPDTVEERWRSLSGLVPTGVSLGPAMDALHQLLGTQGLRLRIHDAGDVDDRPAPATRANLLFDSATDVTRDSQHDLTAGSNAAESFIEAADRRWRLVFERTGGRGVLQWLELAMVLLLGPLTTGLAISHRLQVQATEERLTEEVAARTADLLTSRDTLKTAVSELRRSNTDLARYAEVVAHDLREPTRGIVSFAQLVRRRLTDQEAPLDDVLIEYLDYLTTSAARLHKILGDFSAYTAVSVGPRVLGRVDLEKTLHVVCSRLDPLIRLQGGAVAWDHLPEIVADPEQVTDALTQLVGNGLVHCRPDRPPHLHIDCEDRDGFWRIVVTDNGTGLTEAEVMALAELFRRKGTASDADGDVHTGVGLALARRVAERHGGHLEVLPPPPQGGTRIALRLRKLSLPLALPGAGSDAPVEPADTREDA